MKYIYPKIDIRKNTSQIYYKTYLRIKRDCKWFEIEISDIYMKESESVSFFETFKDKLILTKLFWMPPEKGSKSFDLGIVKQSDNQNDTEDYLLNDLARISRLKKAYQTIRGIK